MTRIARITRAYERHYSDNDQTTTYIEFFDSRGKSGRIEGRRDNPHMAELLRRAEREGVKLEFETW